MTKCAVVQKTNNEVINIIIAEATDLAPDDCYLIDVTNEEFIDLGWFYNPEIKTFYSIESKAY